MADASITTASDNDTDRPTSAELVGRIQRGDRGAFEALYKLHAGRLFPMLWRLSAGNQALAEDWLQEAFIQAWRRIHQLRHADRFTGWLKRLTLNIALADKRANRLRFSEPEPAEQPGPVPPWPAADLDLERAVAALPTRARQVLVLFCLEGLTHAEIAAVMNVDIGTSKAQLHRARQLLKETLS